MFCLPVRIRPLIVLGIASAVTLAALLVVKHVGMEKAGNPVHANSNVTHRHIEYRFSLQNNSNQVLEKGEFWTYGPVKMTATQECAGLTASHPYDLIVDSLGNQVLHFTFQKVPPFATKLIRIQADVDLFSVPLKIQGPDLNGFLKSEELVESNNPEIIELAKKLKSRSPHGSAKNTYRWISENLHYAGFHAADRGALHALRNRRGDCTEYMSLFVALCRANDIPARGIGGYICPDDRILKAGDYHNWAEYHWDGTWRLVDPQNRKFGADQRQYVAMRIINSSVVSPMDNLNRFRTAGEGLKARMEP